LLHLGRNADSADTAVNADNAEIRLRQGYGGQVARCGSVVERRRHLGILRDVGIVGDDGDVGVLIKRVVF
jgi:hypothetical protein